jgi:hypothetical protein
LATDVLKRQTCVMLQTEPAGFRRQSFPYKIRDYILPKERAKEKECKREREREREEERDIEREKERERERANTLLYVVDRCETRLTVSRNGRFGNNIEREREKERERDREREEKE